MREQEPFGVAELDFQFVALVDGPDDLVEDFAFQFSSGFQVFAEGAVERVEFLAVFFTAHHGAGEAVLEGIAAGFGFAFGGTRTGAVLRVLAIAFA